MNRFLKIIFLGVINVHKFLGIAIDHGKPGALNLDHDPMTFKKTMIFIP
jgi:hypothetical protein